MKETEQKVYLDGLVLLIGLLLAPLSFLWSLAAFGLGAFWLRRIKNIVIFPILSAASSIYFWKEWVYQVPLANAKQIYISPFIKENSDFSGLLTSLDSISAQPAFPSFPKFIEWYFESLILSESAFFLHLFVGVFFGSIASMAYLHRTSSFLSDFQKTDEDYKHSIVGNISHASVEGGKASTKDGSIVGTKKFGGVATLKDGDANRHTLILGSSGSGKTVTMCNIIESSIDRNLPTIVVDGKGDRELGKQICKYAFEQGRTVRYLSFGDEQSNCVYDAFNSGNYTSKLNRLITLREWSEDYYKDLSEKHFNQVFQAMEYLNIEFDLSTIRHYIQKPNIIKLIKENALKEDITVEDKERLQSFLDTLTKEGVADKELSSISTSISNFANSTYGKHFYDGERDKNADVLRLKSVLKNNEVVYIGLPNLESSESASSLGKLIINDIKATAVDIANEQTHNLPFLNKSSKETVERKNSEEKEKFYIFFDEFGVFAGNQALNVVNQLRSFGACSVLSTQTLADISASIAKGQDLVTQILGNCNNCIVHQGVPSDDVERISSEIGTRSSIDYTTQMDTSGTTGMGSARNTKKWILHPDDVKRLEKAQAYFVVARKPEFIKCRFSKISQENINN